MSLTDHLERAVGKIDDAHKQLLPIENAGEPIPVECLPELVRVLRLELDALNSLAAEVQLVSRQVKRMKVRL